MLLLSLTNDLRSDHIGDFLPFSTAIWLLPLFLRDLASIRHKRMIPSGSRLPSSRRSSRFFSFVMALFVLIVSFLFTLDLRGNETATTTKILSYCDLKQMAIPNSEDHHCLSGPQVPSRCHCLHCQTIKSGRSPSLQPTISLSKFQMISSHVFQNFPHCFLEKKKILGVFFPKYGAPRTFWNAKLTASKDFLRIFHHSAVYCRDCLVQRTITPSTELCTVFQDHITRLPELWLPATIWSVPSPRRAHQEHRLSHTKLTASIIDLNLKILLFCMRFCPLHTTASV